uniref:non-specific serine/threonine protein kinase n=1 Tax=Glossina brevipalpis TaxID=37001 RepID=A0A1A9W2P4_9MUSC
MAKNIEEANTQTQASNIWSQIESQPVETVVWGRLYGKNIKIKSLDLNTESFTVGRGETNDLMLTLNDLPEKILNRISKDHFVIKRMGCDLSNPVYIKDLSRNGTFVNSEKIGANKQRILQNNDIISLSHPTYKAFVFMDLGPNENIGIPKEITSNYHVSRKLGSGAFGFIRLVYNRRTCDEYAMKIVTKNLLTTNNPRTNLNDPNRVLNEAKIMKDLRHPCVITLYDIFDKPDSTYMIIQYMKGGDLLNRIVNNKRLSEKISKLYFYQMCHAVKYLHTKGITHRDLKPDNVLLQTSDEDTLIKVSDFGLSKFVQNDSVMNTLCGTPLYVAPEVLVTEGRGAYTKKVDIWSLGVVLFTCLSGTLPFSDDYGSPAREQIKRGKFRFNHPSWRTVSKDAISLIKKLLVVDVLRRPSIEDIIEDKWLKNPQMLITAKRLMETDKVETENEENFIGPPAKRLKL